MKSPLNALLKATKMSENGEVSYWIFIFNVSKLIAQTVSSELWKSRIAGIEKWKKMAKCLFQEMQCHFETTWIFLTMFHFVDSYFVIWGSFEVLKVGVKPYYRRLLVYTISCFVLHLAVRIHSYPPLFTVQ